MASFRRDRSRQPVLLAALLLTAAIWSGASGSRGSSLAPRSLEPSARSTAYLAAQQSDETNSPLPVFAFHSGFWINLHHFLYLQARIRNVDASPADSEGTMAPAFSPASLAGLSAKEKQSWKAAVSFYAKDLADLDSRYSYDLETINNRLAEMESCPDLTGNSTPACTSGLPGDLVATLESAAPVYRAHWWPEQDRENRRWIAGVTPKIQQTGARLAERLAEIYRQPWPSAPIRVDVVWYAGPDGAYTTLNPVHLNISSHDPRNQGVYSFEVLFHESSHVLARAVSEAISRDFRQRNKPIPRDLWHALVFYTTGEMIRRDLASRTASSQPTQAGQTGYQTYAEHFGLYLGSWAHFHDLLDLYWRPYLDGKLSFEEAISQIAAAE